MAEKLRIAVDNVVLEVNDNGDTITLPLADERFVANVYDYAETLKNGAEGVSEDSPVQDIMRANIDFHNMAKEKFNDVFGSKSYEKVYGEDIVVGIEYIVQFLEQILPYIESYQNNRISKLSKYSADRVGSM